MATTLDLVLSKIVTNKFLDKIIKKKFFFNKQGKNFKKVLLIFKF
jgi:hypothetical protein